jgi:multicomponent Na+:H+ antiporter subunit E
VGAGRLSIRPPPPSPRHSSGTLLKRVSFGWALALAALWVLLTAPDLSGWWLGVVAAGLGVWAHTALGGRQPGRIRLRGAIPFIPWFLGQSARGGLDVARRALSPSLPLEPGFVTYRTRLPPGPARTFLVNCISLLPGTFTAELEEEGARLRVHVLAEPEQVPDQLRKVEAQVARLFGMTEALSAEGRHG